MLFSSSSMSVCMACLTGLVSNPNNSVALKAAVFFLFLYYVVYTIGFLGIPFLYASEIAPVHLRAAVCGISTAVSWLFNFLVAEITPVAFTDIGYQTLPCQIGDRFQVRGTVKLKGTSVSDLILANTSPKRRNQVCSRCARR